MSHHLVPALSWRCRFILLQVRVELDLVARDDDAAGRSLHYHDLVAGAVPSGPCFRKFVKREFR